MRRTLLITAILLSASATALAQETHPLIEAYGTYQIFRADIDFLGDESLQGWGAGVQWNPWRWVGAVAEINGAYGSSRASGPTVNPLGPATQTFKVGTNVHTYVFGPRASWRTKPATVFVHGLFGFATNSADCSSCPVFTSVNNNQFAMKRGGGVDFNINSGIAIRAAQFDYVPVHSDLGLNGGGSSYLRNWTYQAGIVFKFKQR